MALTDCVFCHNITTNSFDVIGRGQRTLVVLDQQPINRGHVLVLPLRHAPDLPSLTEDEVIEIAVVAQRADRAIRAVFDSTTTGTNLLMSNGESADQGVPHAHLHVIPRNEGDGYEFQEDVTRYPLAPIKGPEREALRRSIGFV
ncbi:HIT family protein [Curtobacterium sp. BH-2-1-1]|uniref:HIT family protein n=1 Tax=Curtobacterium sp. BH-2-1-1 TaxID=1905847 RepID=UPI0011A25EC2|nr:HIT family protein [Curtobacterium sp. BH-2-1-1]